MDLKSFIKQHPNQEMIKNEMALALGLNGVASISHWMYGYRQVPAKHVPGIVMFSKGVVSPESLRPDMNWQGLMSMRGVA